MRTRIAPESAMLGECLLVVLAIVVFWIGLRLFS